MFLSAMLFCLLSGILISTGRTKFARRYTQTTIPIRMDLRYQLYIQVRSTLSLGGLQMDGVVNQLCSWYH